MATQSSDVLTPKRMLGLPRPLPALPNPRGDRFLQAASTFDFETRQTKLSLHVGSVSDSSGLRELAFSTCDAASDAKRDISNDKPASDAQTTTEAPKRALASLETAWLDDSTVLWLRAPVDGAKGVELWARGVDSDGEYRVASVPVAISSVTVNAHTESSALLVFAAEVYPATPALDQVEVEDEKHKEAQNGSSAMVYDRLWPRHWDSWVGTKRQQLFSARLHRVEGKWAVKGDFHPLLAGTQLECPVPPFGGVSHYVVSPDGSMLAFSAKDPDRDPAVYTTQPLYLLKLAADGSPAGAPLKLTVDGLNGATNSPTFSSDGQLLAFAAQELEQHESDRWRIVVTSLTEGRPISADLAPSGPAALHAIRFSHDGRSILATAWDKGHGKLFSISLNKSEPRALTAEHTVVGFAPLPSGKLLVTKSSYVSPNEVFALSVDGELAKVGSLLMSMPLMGQTEEFWFKSEGRDVHGFIIRPHDFNATKKWPLIYRIHGGPQPPEANVWSTRWNGQVFASAGYIYVSVNFAGSDGYGQAFADAVCGDFGGKSFGDMRAGLKHVLASYPYIDQGRMASMGNSYGGWAQCWLQAFGRDLGFKCLIGHGIISNLADAWYEGDELFCVETCVGGTPWEAHDKYDRFNPILHADKWSTPMLITHGELDYRIPVTSALAAFNLLRRKGVPSRLVVFPDENHFILKPLNALRLHEEIFRWLEQWTPAGPR